MKLLIIYSTKNGTTEKCVEHLQSVLKGLDITVACLEKDPLPNLDAYDVVLVGGSVYFGKFRPALRQFLKDNEARLCQKELGLFFCCGLAHDMEYYMEKLFSQRLRDAAFQTVYFGGSLKIQGCGLLDRMILHSMRSSIFESEIDDGEYTPTLPSILPESIEKMGTYVREVYRKRK